MGLVHQGGGVRGRRALGVTALLGWIISLEGFGSGGRALRVGRYEEHLIRSSGQVVQDRPLRFVCWADIPELSIRAWRCPPSWQ